MNLSQGRTTLLIAHGCKQRAVLVHCCRRGRAPRRRRHHEELVASVVAQPAADVFDSLGAAPVGVVLIAGEEPLCRWRVSGASPRASERTAWDRRSPRRALRELLNCLVVLDVRGALDVVDPVGDHQAAHIPEGHVDLETVPDGTVPGSAATVAAGSDVFADSATRGRGRHGRGRGNDHHGLSVRAVVAAALDRPRCVLDGGLGAWRAAGGPIATGADPPPAPSSIPLVARPGAMRTVTADEIGAGLDAVLVDARAWAERYRGETEPAPIRVRPEPAVAEPPRPRRDVPAPAELRAGFEAVGLRDGGPPVVTYCGSGVTAAHARSHWRSPGSPRSAMYPPSWSGWGQRPGAARS